MADGMKTSLWIEDAILWQKCQAFDYAVQERCREKGDLKNAIRYQAYSRDDFILYQDAMQKIKETPI